MPLAAEQASTADEPAYVAATTLPRSHFPGLAKFTRAEVVRKAP